MLKKFFGCKDCKSPIVHVEEIKFVSLVDYSIIDYYHETHEECIISNISQEALKLDFETKILGVVTNFSFNLQKGEKIYVGYPAHVAISFLLYTTNGEVMPIKLNGELRQFGKHMYLFINQEFKDKLTISQKNFDSRLTHAWYKLYDFGSGEFIEDKSPETIDLWEKINPKD